MKILSKKIVAIMLIIVMLMSFVPSVPATAVEPTVTMNITNETATTKSVKAGDTVSIDVMLENGKENQAAITAIVEYDSTKLQFVEDATDMQGNKVLTVDKGGLNANISDGMQTGYKSTVTENGITKDVVIASYLANVKPIATSGRLATIKFKVLEGFSEATTISVFKAQSSDVNSDNTLTVGNSITVNPIIPMTRLKISQETAELTKGGTLKLIATKEPAGTSDEEAISWSSNNKGVATVDQNGNVTAVGNGTATITATCGSYTAKCEISVTTPMAGLEISQETAELTKGGTLKLTATKEPAGTSDEEAISWSSDNEGVATVDKNGKVTAVGKGTATITATCGEFSKTCKVTVTIPMTGLKLDENTVAIKLYKEDEISLKVTKLPEDTTDLTEITWTSSDETVATVDENGKVIAVGRGTAKITASCGEYSVYCTVEVSVLLKSISINEGDQELKVTQEKNLTVSYNPEDTTDSKAITWESSDETVVKVENGKITALKPGEATITAKGANNTSASINVTVPTVLATEVIINKAETKINKGDSEQLTATILPEDTTETKTITWKSSDETVATVDQTGKVTAVKGGTATITATAEGLVPAECLVNVESPLESITLSETNVTLEEGDTTKLTVTLNPEDTTNADVADVEWESLNERVVTVSEGKILAVGPGTATIKAKLNGKEATCTVKVIVILTGVEINNSSKDLELVKGTKGTLNVTLTPENATEIPDRTWSSSDETVATVDENGVVTALKVGTATITVKYGDNITATRKVVVTEIPTTGIVFDNTIEEILKGKDNKVQITAKAYPENTTDDVVITWSSSDETVATVDENGVVTGLKAGKATITATYNGISNSMEIEVKEIALHSIEVSSSSATVEEGGKTQIKVECTPENTTDEKIFTYESSDESIATVDENGVVTGLKAGKVTITVTSKVNPLATSSVEIEIKEKTVAPNGGGNSTGTVAGTIGQVATSTVTSPHTGDMNIALLIGMLIISILGIVCVVKKK